MTAAEVKHRLYTRHPGSGGQMPGPWTVTEEWRNIDLLAFSAWSSQGDYARVGYEVKVSRADLRAELMNPGKRLANVAWCNEFYLAVPRGLLTDDEIVFEEPEWQHGDFSGPKCPGFAGQMCMPKWKRKRHMIYLAKPSTTRYSDREYVVCPTCNGKGAVGQSRVEREAPTCWVPRDIGLVIVDGRGSKLVRKSPRRAEVPALSAGELGQLVRWISLRPDPRHSARHQARELRQAVAA